MFILSLFLFWLTLSSTTATNDSKRFILIPIAQSVFSIKEQRELLHSWADTIDDVSKSIIQSFDVLIMQKKKVLINNKLVQCVFAACREKRDIDFAEKVWIYFSQNALQKPNQALYTQLLNIYKTAVHQTEGIRDKVWREMFALTSQWIKQYTTDKHSLNIASNTQTSDDVEFLNVVMEIIVNNTRCDIEKRQKWIRLLFNLMIELGIEPNTKTKQQVIQGNKESAKSANLSMSSSANLSEFRIARFVLKNAENMVKSSCEWTINEFMNIVDRNWILAESEIIVPMLIACQQCGNISAAQSMWDYITNANNCWKKPTHLVYSEMMNVYRSGTNSVQNAVKAGAILRHWAKQFEEDNASLQIAKSGLSEWEIFNTIIEMASEISSRDISPDVKIALVHNLRGYGCDLLLRQSSLNQS